jgi:hypothetical protein
MIVLIISVFSVLLAIPLGIIIGKMLFRPQRPSLEDRQRLREANWRAGDRRR